MGNAGHKGGGKKPEGVSELEPGFALLPNSPEWKVAVTDGAGKETKKTLGHWEFMQKAFERHSNLDSVEAFENLVGELQTNRKRWTFRGMRALVNEVYNEKQRKNFLEKTLPYIRKKALELDKLFPEPVRLLVSNPPVKSPEEEELWTTLKLSRAQVLSVLANYFFCTMPYSQSYEKEYFPAPNFNMVFQDSDPHQLAKLQHIVHYFERCAAEDKEEAGEGDSTPADGSEASTSTSSSTSSPPGLNNEFLVFKRMRIRPLKTSQDLAESNTPLRQFTVFPKGSIESATNAVHVDFANKYIGGGVLQTGCVQEEIRFSINTELLATMTFVSVLNDDEALFMTGSQRFSDYAGYARSWRYAGDAKETSPRNAEGSFITPIVAMDAISYGNSSLQFEEKYMLRDTNKALAAFQSPGNDLLPEGYSIATGNWGCGVFGGAVQLKSMEQWIAASEQGFDVLYYAFGDKNSENLKDIAEKLLRKKVTVGQLWGCLMSYKERNPDDLFKHISRTLLE